MSEYEYEEENLDDFMIKASQILLSETNDEEKEIIIESLKQHLTSIFNNELEIQNFYKTLNMVIFQENSTKIINKKCFKIFPIIFAFNPNSCFYYIDFYLFSLNQSIQEENKADFAFLSVIFSEIITILFSEEKLNKYLISNDFLLEENKKYKLYEKIFNFLKQKIKSQQKITQSFGCLLLTELIEKCPIIKQQKYLEDIFKLLSNYLEDKNFKCKLDILNCLISLIFITEKKFMPYSNICLFRVLDYLTDDQWIMRKLSINIVYTLVFFCKEEIMLVKDNIIEFLNILKEDPIEEIKEVCLQTLKLLEEKPIENNLKDKSNGINYNVKNSEDIIISKEEENINDSHNITKERNIEDISIKTKENEVGKEKKLNKFINRHNHLNNTDKKKKMKTNKINNKFQKSSQNKSHKNIKINRNKNSNYLAKFTVNTKNISSRTPIRNKSKKDYKNDNLIKTQITTDKRPEDKNEIFNSLGNADTKNNSGNKNEQTPEKSNRNDTLQNEKIINLKNIEKEYKNNIAPNNENDRNKIHLIENKTKEKEEEYFEKTLTDIIGQLGKIQEGQEQFLNMINDLKTRLNDNYDNLNERISTLEKNYFNENNGTIKSIYINRNSYKSNNKRKGKNSDVNELKNKFRLGKFNEALSEAIHNENNLFKLLPLIDRNNIGKISNEIMDDVINILNKKLILINLEYGRTVLSDILSFYLCLIKSKIPLKLISQLNIKDSLLILQNKNSDRLLQIDINNIDAIVKSLKV